MMPWRPTRALKSYFLDLYGLYARMESSRVAHQILSTVTDMAKMGLRDKKGALTQIAGDLAPSQVWHLALSQSTRPLQKCKACINWEVGLWRADA